jgi:catechol 2,3-dioxygenase-like lactoylglutathione lyase family enzyme
MAVIRLQHASVPMTTDGNDKARHFYGETLGLTEVTPPDVLGTERFVWFTIGDSGDEIHCYTDDRGGNSPGQHLCIQVEDPAGVRSALEAGGYETADTDAIPNRPRFFTTDPFGNRVEISAILGPYS